MLKKFNFFKRESPTGYGDGQVRVYRLWKKFKEYEGKNL
jgi:hypothetical protein